MLYSGITFQQLPLRGLSLKNSWVQMIFQSRVRDGNLVTFGFQNFIHYQPD